MSSSLRRATIMILLGVILVPGLLQAKTPARDWASVHRPASISGFFSMVWNLLMDFREIGAGIDPSGAPFAKNGGENGGMLDPNGSTTPSSSASGGAGTGGENGGMLDPNG